MASSKDHGYYMALQRHLWMIVPQGPNWYHCQRVLQLPFYMTGIRLRGHIQLSTAGGIFQGSWEVWPYKDFCGYQPLPTNLTHDTF